MTPVFLVQSILSAKLDVFIISCRVCCGMEGPGSQLGMDKDIQFGRQDRLDQENWRHGAFDGRWCNPWYDWLCRSCETVQHWCWLYAQPSDLWWCKPSGSG